MKAKPTNRPGAVLLEVTDKDEKLLASAKAEAPFRIKNILVPIDFSDCSRKALRYAIALAKEHEASISLLYVVSTNFAMGEPSSIEYVQFTSEARAKAQKELQALAAAEVHGEVIAKSFVRAGSPTAEILQMAASMPADIIVISTHGHTGLTHALLGSVTEHVVQRAPCPVLVVREREHECLACA
jgi:nucleotide-binding universal stress UspA family protein